LATFSISSFFLMAYEFGDPFSQFMISSAKHSEKVLWDLKVEFLDPTVI